MIGAIHREWSGHIVKRDDREGAARMRLQDLTGPLAGLQNLGER